jgi:hypothetical protein
MIGNDEELRVTLSRIERFQQQVARLRQVETNATNYRLSAEGYLAEIDRMNLEVRDYLSLLPSEVTHDRGVPLDSQ